VTRPIVVLVRIRLAEILSRPSGALWFFALPLLLLGLVAVLFHGGHPFERRHVAIVGDPNLVADALGGEVRAGALVLEPARDEERAHARLETRVVSAIVVTGAGAVPSRIIVGERDELFGRGLVAVLGGSVLEATPLPESGYFRFLVPGMLAQGVVVAGLFGMGYAMVRYRQSRFLRKLATTPLSRGEFVLAQIVARVVLVTLQLLLLLLAIRAAIGLPLSAAAIVSVLLVGAMGLVAFMGIGFVISCVVETEAMVVDIINTLLVPIALLSEIFFSNDELPRSLRIVASALPSTVMVRAMRDVLVLREDVVASVVPAVGILGAWGIVSYLVAVRVFRWR
jgi:ABC-type multidrug transport system permease subunit